jgi:hypothetical protein
MRRPPSDASSADFKPLIGWIEMSLTTGEASVGEFGEAGNRLGWLGGNRLWQFRLIASRIGGRIDLLEVPTDRQSLGPRRGHRRTPLASRAGKDQAIDDFVPVLSERASPRDPISDWEAT